MRKLLIVSFAVVLSFGFTFSGDTDLQKNTECPYSNETHSSVESSDCPYMKSRMSKNNENKKEVNGCPYTGKIKNESSECPYLKQKEKVNSEEIKPTKIIKLKAS